MNTWGPRTLRRAGVSCSARIGSALLLFGAGCVQPPDTRYDPDAFYGGPTSIVELSVSCSSDDDEWAVQVDTVGWTAGGLFAWTADGQYLEEHDLTSDEADFYGEWDLLLTELSVSADPRTASKNASTALLCDPPTREGLRGWLTIYHPETEAPVDCRVWGEDFDWVAAGYEACEARAEIALR